jgi:OmpA family
MVAFWISSTAVVDFLSAAQLSSFRAMQRMEIMKKLLFLSAGLLIGVGVSAAQDYPKAEVAFGYSFVNVHPDIPQITSYNINGGGASFVYNAAHYFGIKAEFMDYTGGGGAQLRALGYNGNVSGNFFTYEFGPIIKKHSGRVQPFGEALFGAAHSGTYALIYNTVHGIQGAGNSNNTFAMALGGGLDIPVNHVVSIRPVEVDYLFTQFSANNIKATQNNFRYFAGIDLTFGGKPPIPPTASCSASPTEIWSGDPVSATISTLNFNPKHTVTYSWSASGGKVSGTGTTGNVDTTGLAPGSYTISATATDAKQKKNNTASCTASFTVRQPRPPTATCSASPDTIKPGDSFTFTVVGQSLDNSSLSYSYSTSAGNISGTGSSASETTSAANANSSITATANVVDARGLSTTCSATVTVLPFPVVAAPPEVVSAGECKFNMSNKPGRVDNECKAVLDEVALQVQRQPNGKVVVVGYTDETETVKMTQLAGQRAVNVKYYLTSGEGGAGIDASRIEARAGTAKNKSAKIYIVPDGATFTEESTVVDETQVKGQPRNPGKKSK